MFYLTVIYLSVFMFTPADVNVNVAFICIIRGRGSLPAAT